MANGLTARLPEPGDPLGQFPLLAMAHVGGQAQRGGRNDCAFLAAPLSAAALQQRLSHLVGAQAPSPQLPLLTPTHDVPHLPMAVFSAGLQ